MDGNESAWSMFLVILTLPGALMIFLVYGERLLVRYVSRRWSDVIAAVSASLIVALIALTPYKPGLQAAHGAERVLGMPIFFWLFMGLVLASGGMLIYVGMFRRKVKWLITAVLCISAMWYFAWPYLEELAPSTPRPPVVRMVKQAPKQGVIFCTLPDAPVSYGRVHIPERVEFAREFAERIQLLDLVLVDIWPGEWFDCNAGEYAFDFRPNTRKRISDIPGR